MYAEANCIWLMWLLCLSTLIAPFIQVQDLLLEGLESVAETLIEGLSRVKKCSDEGRALMSLDLQVLINGLKHFVSIDVRPKLQIVETYIKAYYLPETEYVHWSRAHPEYSKSQIVGLINLVASMKGWKRKTRFLAYFIMMRMVVILSVSVTYVLAAAPFLYRVMDAPRPGFKF
ncbi:UNVERIFIED_CONTAM: Syndetin [Sesamum latifolium]|uniref:Syndetin n=1 Tax=Sesamum latifolium TaxID=2727402 RepID=A0AAW2Y336_9LAMI